MPTIESLPAFRADALAFLESRGYAMRPVGFAGGQGLYRVGRFGQLSLTETHVIWLALCLGMDSTR